MYGIIGKVVFTAFILIAMPMVLKSYIPFIREILLENRLKGILVSIVFLLLIGVALFAFFSVLSSAP